MGAKVYNSPTEVQPPNFSDYLGGEGTKPWEQLEKDEKAYEEKLSAYCRKHLTEKQSPLVGKVWRTPMADSHASYMVLSTSPLALIHMPLGDAWHADPIMLRGLRVSDLKRYFSWS